MPTTAFEPLSYDLFLQFIAVPHVAMHLIALDLEVCVEEGYETMLNTGEYGLVMSPIEDDDDEFDKISRANSQKLQKFHDMVRSAEDAVVDSTVSAIETIVLVNTNSV
jgi:hypothetical protein